MPLVVKELSQCSTEEFLQLLLRRLGLEDQQQERQVQVQVLQLMRFHLRWPFVEVGSLSQTASTEH